MQEIRAGGGDANIVEARFVEGLTDSEVQQLFNAARDADYEEIVAHARRLTTPKKKVNGEDLASEVTRLHKRFAEVEAIDFFGAPKGHVVAALIELKD